MRWRLVGGVCLAGLLVPAASSASSFQALGAGQIVTTLTPGTSMTTPADGLLRTSDAQTVVNGVAWPTSINGYMATTGHRLVAFAVTLSEPATTVNSGSSNPVSLSLAVDGSMTSLDLSAITSSIGGTASGTGSGSENFIASVPNATHNVELRMSQGGFTQAFSLWSLKRTSSAPASLYANRSSSSVTDTIGLTEQIPLTDPSTGTTWNSVVQVSSASLQAFQPGGTGAVAPPGKSYLTINMTSAPVQRQLGDPLYGSFYAAMTPLPGSDITLTDSASHSFTATQSNPGDPSSIPDSSTNDGLLNATYSFLVPDSFTGGTVSIGATTTTGATFTYFTQDSATGVTVGGPTTFPVSFPAPPKPAVQTTPPWVGKPTPPTLASSSGGGESSTPGSSGGGLSIWLAAVALVVVAGAAELFRRSRKRSAATKADDGDLSEHESPKAPEVFDPASASDQPQDPTVGAVATTDASVLRVDFMGAVRIVPVTMPADEFARAFISYLAVHNDRARTVDDTQTALWPLNGTERDITRKTFLNRVSDARRVVGAEHLPGKVEQSGYRLIDVVCDWDEFRALVARVPELDRTDAIQLRAQALELVRGVPFESDVSPWFTWADSEGLRTTIETAVIAVARDQARALVAIGDDDGAEAALHQGLKVNPTEMTLWEDLGRIAVARADPNASDRFWRDIAACLDPDSVTIVKERLGA